MNENELIQYNMMVMIARMQLWWTELLLRGIVPLPNFPEPCDIYTVGPVRHSPDGGSSQLGIVIKTWRN